MNRRPPLLRAAGGAACVLALASLARADAPTDQYNLFNQNSIVIQDLRTQLVWQRTPPGTAMLFGDAATYCSTLSLSTYSGGWRVPSYKELMTIVDETPYLEYLSTGMLKSVWLDGNAFPFADVGQPYWTSSMFPGQPGYAYTVSFDDGVPQQQDTTGTNQFLVRCVH